MEQKNRMEKKIRVLMCGSDVNRAKGGMVSVIRNYLSCEDWEDIRICYVPTHINGSSLKKAVYFAVAYLRIFGMLLLRRVDVAHLHVSERGSFFRKSYLTNLLKWFHIPVLLHHHGAEFFPFYESLPESKKKYVRKTLLKADRNLLLSEYVEKQYLKAFPKIRTAVLLNATPVPAENPYNLDGSYILTLGKLGQRKGTYDLLKAFKRLETVLPEKYRLCLCGDGDVEQVREEVKRLGLAGRVAHVGWIEGEEKEHYLKMACLHVLPSYYEGLPMSILETMARGIPNISTRIAAIPEVIEDGRNGILIEPGDVAALSEEIGRLVVNEEKRKLFSTASYETVMSKFSFEQTRKKLETVYKRAVRDVK